jgi:hypothetical protein
MTSPVGSFSNDYGQDHSFALDLEYLLSQKLALVGLLGYNAFNATSSGVDDTYLINLSANLKYRHPLRNSWSTYVAGGPGYYFPEAGGSGMGANIGVGFEQQLILAHWRPSVFSELHRWTYGQFQVFYTPNTGISPLTSATFDGFL